MTAKDFSHSRPNIARWSANSLPEEQISDQEEIEVDEKKKGLPDGIIYDDGEGVPDGIIYDDKDRKCIN